MTTNTNSRRIGVLISGRGSNLQALIEATRLGQLDATIAVVISNRSDATGLAIAADADIETLCIDHEKFPNRDEFDQEIAKQLKLRNIGLVCLAGFMRLVGAPLIETFPNAILNIHPSLLPAFPGLNAQKKAVEHGVKVSGVTVHIVTKDLDAGPIVLQRSVSVSDQDTPETLAGRILKEEHRIYPEAVGLYLQGGWKITGRRFIKSSAEMLS
jgi:phosphoribosylglycinamide formyltransferase-1